MLDTMCSLLVVKYVGADVKPYNSYYICLAEH